MPQITIETFTAPAKEYEGEMDAAFTEEAPKGRFSKAVMNELVAAYREAQGLMGFPEAEMYPMFEEAVVTEFPPEFVRGLAMLAKAAEDYGQPGMIDLSAIKDDAAVATLAAKVKKLAQDPEFKAFLESPPEGESKGSEYAEEGGMSEEEDMDKMFASRA